MTLHSWRTLALAAGVALVSGTAPAQQPPALKPQPAAPSKPGTRTQAPQTQQKAPPGEYERYEASHRQRLRTETCMRDEDLVRQYCIKRCQRGFVNVSGESIPRMCRGAKPMPPGVQAPPMRKETGQKSKAPGKIDPKSGA